MARFQPTEDQIREWIETNFDNYKIRKNGQEYLMPNPFYHNDKLKFNISVSKAAVHDWRGDEWAKGGSPTFLRFVQLYNKCSYAEAVKEVCGDSVNLKALARKINKQKQEQYAKEDRQKKQIKLVLPDGSMPILKSSHPTLAKMCATYLKSRGIDEDLITQYNLHHLAMNVIWPYYEYEDLVYYQSRNITNKIFDFPGESNKGDYLFGFDQIEPSDYLIATEAIIDAMTLGAQCVATCGAGLSDMQVRKIRALNPIEGVILAPDNDKAGKRSIVRDYKLLSPYFPVYYALPPSTYNNNAVKDWNELGKQAGFGKVRSIFESSIAPVDPAALVVLTKA